MIRTIACTAALLGIVFCAACSPSTPMPTPTKTPGPMVSPVPTADSAGGTAPTPIPAPVEQANLSGVILALSDLPPGFQAATPENLAPVAEGFTRAPFYDVSSISGFTSTHPEGPELIVSFGGYFTEDDPFREDAPATQKPLWAVYMFIVGAGTQTINDSGLLEGLEGIGEEAWGYYGLADLEERPIRVDMIVFRRGRAGVYVFHLYPQELTPGASVNALARILDIRLSTAMDGP